MIERLLTIEQAAECLSVSTGTIRQMLPRLGAVDLNQGSKGRRLIRIPESKVMQLLQGSVIHDAMKHRAPTGPRRGFHVERRRA